MARGMHLLLADTDHNQINWASRRHFADVVCVPHWQRHALLTDEPIPLTIMAHWWPRAPCRGTVCTACALRKPHTHTHTHTHRVCTPLEFSVCCTVHITSPAPPRPRPLGHEARGRLGGTPAQNDGVTREQRGLQGTLVWSLALLEASLPRNEAPGNPPSAGHGQDPTSAGMRPYPALAPPYSLSRHTETQKSME